MKKKWDLKRGGGSIRVTLIRSWKLFRHRIRLKLSLTDCSLKDLLWHSVYCVMSATLYLLLESAPLILSRLLRCLSRTYKLLHRLMEILKKRFWSFAWNKWTLSSSGISVIRFFYFSCNSSRRMSVWFWILWRCHLNHSFMISSSWSSELQALIFMLRHMQTLALCKQTCIFLQLFPCLHHFFHEDLIVPLRCTLRDNSLRVVTLTNTFISILVLQVKSFTSNFNELRLHSTIY